MARYSDARLIKLEEEFQQHTEHTDKRFQDTINMIERNVEATERLAASISEVAESVSGVVQLYNDGQATLRMWDRIRGIASIVIAIAGGAAAWYYLGFPF